jgi:phage-related protein
VVDISTKYKCNGVIIIEIFKLWGSIFVDNEKANKAIDETDEKAERTSGTFEKMGGMFTKVGGLVMAGAAVAGTAITGIMSKTMEATNEINKFSQVTGMSKKGFQEWDSVAKNFGFSMEAAAGDMAALAERAMDAASGAGENAEMFKKLGVSVTDNNGALKTQEQLFNETIAGLQGMENVTERNAIATAMLSTTGEELAPVLNMTNEELQKMKGNAKVISDEDLAKAQQFTDKWNGVKNTFSNLMVTIGLKLMPVFESLYNWMNSNLLPVLSNLWTFFKDNIQPIFSKFFDDQSKNMPLLKEIVSGVFSGIAAWASTVWTFFKDNLLPIFTGLYTWIQGHMPAIRETVSQVFGKIKEVVSAVWAFYKDNFLPILARLFEFIQGKMPQIQSIVERVFGIVASVVKAAWDIFENFLLPVLKKLWDWISPHIPKIQKAIETGFNAIVTVIEGVVGVFETVTSAIQKAVDWLGKWNDKPTKKKTVEVEERRTTTGGNRIPGYAVGTNFHQGGLAMVGERGAEILELPRGSKVNTANQTKQMLNGGELKSLVESIKQLASRPISIAIDGREIALATAEDMDEQLAFITNRKAIFSGMKF